MKIPFLYFNLSDLINQNDFNNFYKFDMIEDYEHMDKFGGFFFNLKNITKNEIENFLIFYGSDLTMLENEKFISKIIFFFSLFLNQSIIFFFIKCITIAELYIIFSNNFITKFYINMLLSLLNKRILLEIYRFFLSFKFKYSNISFKKFKLFIISSAFFFDSNKLLYHYYYFISPEAVGFDLYYRYYSNFLEDVFMNKLSFLNIIEYLCDSLIFNLYKINQINLNLNFSHDSNFFDFKFLKKFNNNLLVKFKYDRYLYFLKNINDYFILIHEFFIFFRFYLYIFYKLNLKLKKNFIIFYKYYKFFIYQYFKLIKFYDFYNFFGFNQLKNLLFKFFFEIKLIIFNLIFNKKIELFNNFFFNFQFLFLKFFNNCKFSILFNFLKLNPTQLFLRYNNYILSLFLKISLSINVNSLPFSQFLFNSNIFINNNYINNKLILIKFIKNMNFSFNLKKNLIFFFFKNLIFNFKKLNFFFWFNSFYTKRTIFNYNFFNKKLKFSFSYSLYKNNFINKYHNFFSLMSMLSLQNILLTIFSFPKIYYYIPIFFRIKHEIEDFFFLLNEEMFAEDFNYFLDDVIFDDKEESDVDDAEDDTDHLDNFFDETDPYSLYMFLFIEDTISINYYIYDIYIFKYSDLLQASLKFESFGNSNIYDFNYSKIAPYLSKKILLFGGSKFVNEMNASGWFNWICFSLFSDLNSFNPNFFGKFPESRLVKNNLINYFYFGPSSGHKTISHLSPIAKKNQKEFILEPLLNSDSSLLLSYSSFNESYNRIIYNSYEQSNEDIDESFIRDLVVLNDMWIWWEYMTKIFNLSNNYKKNFKSKIQPSNFIELLFLNTYILSGLPFIINSILGNSTNEEKNNRLIKIEKSINSLYSNENFLNKNLPLIASSVFDDYYNNWLNIYSGIIFLNDYSDLVEDLIIFSDKKIVNLDSFFILQKYEKIFLYYLTSTFKFSILSFYSYNKKIKLDMFWEHFFLNIIEISYSLIDLDFINDFQGRAFQMFFYDENLDKERANIIKSIDFIYSNLQASENELSGDYLNLYLSDLNNPYLLLFNGLNISVSLSEIIFFDLYESYLDSVIDTDQDDYDSNAIMNFKFFEFDDLELRDNDEEVSRAFQQELQFDYNDTGFEYYEERNAHESIQNVNYYIGEGYDYYLNRYYSIFKYNIFLFGLFTTFLKKNSFFSFNFNTINNNTKLFKIISNRNYLIIDLISYKLQLIYYYFINFFFFFLKKKLNFNVFILILVFYYFIWYIKSINFNVKFQIFFLLFFSGYFYYIFILLLKNKFNYSILEFLNLDLKQIYSFFKFFLKILLNFILIIVKSYKFLYFRKIFFSQYKVIIFYILEKKIYILFFQFLFQLNKVNLLQNNIQKNFLNFKFNLKISSFRSFISTLSIYSMENKFIFQLFSNHNLFSFFFRKHIFNSVIDLSLTTKYNNKVNFNNNYFSNFLKINQNFSSFSVDNLFLDNYDSIKESSYHDYEDLLDDEEFYTDEWTADFTIGDLSDDYEDDTYDDKDSLDFNKEELNFELDLDSTFIYLVQENENMMHFYKYTDNSSLWSNRFNYILNDLYYYNLKYIKYIFIKLLSYYKIKVPMLTSINLQDSFRYYKPNNNEYKIKYTKFNFANSIQLRNSNFTKLKSLSKQNLFNFPFYKESSENKFNKLIPKYLYTFDLIDILDYFIDFNNLEISEFNESYSSYNTIIGFNLSKDQNFENINIYFIQIISFYKYVFLYINIYQYVDKINSSKLLLYSFFFFDLTIFFKKIIYTYILKKPLLLKNLNIKYIFNKIYIFFLKNLKKFYEIDFLNKTINNNIIILNTYKFIPFFSFNYKVNLKKILILKAFFSTYLTFFSYFLFIKLIDYLKLFNLSKKIFFNFFFKIKKYLKLFESLIYINAYKLAQIYSKYGLVDSFFFFENLITNNHFNNNIQFFYKKYNYIYINLFIIELLLFCLVCFILLFFLVNISSNIFFTQSFWPKFFRSREDGFHVMLISYNRHIFENKMSYLLNKTWLDLWGVF